MIVAAAFLAPFVVGGGVFLAGRLRDRQAARAERRANSIAMLRHGQARIVFALMLERLRERVHPDLLSREKHQDAQKVWDERRTAGSARTWKGAPPSTGYLILTVFMTAVWVTSFLLIRSADIYVLQALGHSLPVAQVLGTVVALLYTVLGWYVTGLLGWHQVLPAGLALPRWAKWAAVTAALAVGVLLTLGVREIAPYRSLSTVGAELAVSEKKLAQVKATGTPVQLQVAQKDVDALRIKLENAKQFDVLLVTVMPVGEILTSGAPIVLGEAALIGGAAMWAEGHRLLAARAHRRVAGAEQRMRREGMELVQDAGVDPTVYDRAIASLEQGTDAGVTADGHVIVEGAVIDDFERAPASAQAESPVPPIEDVPGATDADGAAEPPRPGAPTPEQPDDPTQRPADGTDRHGDPYNLF